MINLTFLSANVSVDQFIFADGYHRAPCTVAFAFVFVLVLVIVYSSSSSTTATATIPLVLLPSRTSERKKNVTNLKYLSAPVRIGTHYALLASYLSPFARQISNFISNKEILLTTSFLYFLPSFIFSAVALLLFKSRSSCSANRVRRKKKIG